MQSAAVYDISQEKAIFSLTACEGVAKTPLESSPTAAQITTSDPDLVALVRAWAKLPDSDRRRLLEAAQAGARLAGSRIRPIDPSRTLEVIK